MTLNTSKCGPCYTNEHYKCVETLKSQKGWYCACALFKHGKRKTAIPKTKRK